MRFVVGLFCGTFRATMPVIAWPAGHCMTWFTLMWSVRCTLSLMILAPGTVPMSLLILFYFFLFLLGRLPKKPKAASFQIGSGLNLADCSSSKYRICRRI